MFRYLSEVGNLWTGHWKQCPLVVLSGGSGLSRPSPATCRWSGPLPSAVALNLPNTTTFHTVPHVVGTPAPSP